MILWLGRKEFVFNELSLFIFPKADKMVTILKDSLSTNIQYSKSSDREVCLWQFLNDLTFVYIVT